MKPMIQIALLFGGLALLLFLFWFTKTIKEQKTTPPPPGLAQVTIGDVTVSAEIAATSREKFQGLSGRKGLDTNAGMLFLWDQNVSTGFTMRRMEFPLKEGKNLDFPERLLDRGKVPGFQKLGQWPSHALDERDHVLRLLVGESGDHGAKRLVKLGAEQGVHPRFSTRRESGF